MGNRVATSKSYLYNESYKHCLLSRMQEVRMTDFDYSIRNLLFPAMAKDGKTPVQVTEDSIWYLKGTATFRTSSKEWKQEAMVAAYRDKGEWCLTPPQWSMQKEWEKAHYIEADFVADRTDEITVQNSPISPIQITDVHVQMDRKFPSLRNLSYTLKNTTAKGIAGFTIEAAIEDPAPGAVIKSGPQNIPPHGYVRGELDTTAYGDYCAGIYRDRLFIQEVRFEDGSEWKLPGADDQSLSGASHNK